MAEAVQKKYKQNNTAHVRFVVEINYCEEIDGYSAKCDMPGGGCIAQGNTLQEVQKQMIEAVDFFLDDYPDVKNYYLFFEVQNA